MTFLENVMQKRQKKKKKSRNDYMCYHTHKTQIHFRKVRVIPKAFGLEQMSGGSNKYLQNKSWQCTDEVIHTHGCSPSPTMKGSPM